MKRILIVEEYCGYQKLLSLLLLHFGYGVQHADSAHTALLSMATDPVDAVLCSDLHCQHGAPYLLEQLQAQTGTRQIPFIYMSDALDTEMFKALRDAGGGFVAKPLQLSTLSSVLGRALWPGGRASLLESLVCPLEAQQEGAHSLEWTRRVRMSPPEGIFFSAHDLAEAPFTYSIEDLMNEARTV